MNTIINDKISRAATYLEPDLYSVLSRTAAEEGVTVSAWLRSLAVEKLAAKGKISQELLLRLAAA